MIPNDCFFKPNRLSPDSLLYKPTEISPATNHCALPQNDNAMKTNKKTILFISKNHYFLLEEELPDVPLLELERVVLLLLGRTVLLELERVVLLLLG